MGLLRARGERRPGPKASAADRDTTDAAAAIGDLTVRAPGAREEIVAAVVLHRLDCPTSRRATRLHVRGTPLIARSARSAHEPLISLHAPQLSRERLAHEIGAAGHGICRDPVELLLEQHDVVALALIRQPRRRIDRPPEVVQATIGRHGDRRADVDAHLEDELRIDVLVLTPALEPLLHVERRSERVIEPVEGTHHPVPDRLDDAPARARDALSDEVEVAVDAAKAPRRRSLIQTRGPPDVAEHQGDVPYRELLPRGEHLRARTDRETPASP